MVEYLVLIKLNLSNLDGKLITVPSEKSEAQRVVGFPESLAAMIQEYVEEYRSQTDRKSLFTTTKGGLNYNYARNVVKSIATKSGVPNSMHTLQGTGVPRTC